MLMGRSSYSCVDQFALSRRRCFGRGFVRELPGNHCKPQQSTSRSVQFHLTAEPAAASTSTTVSSSSAAVMLPTAAGEGHLLSRLQCAAIPVIDLSSALLAAAVLAAPGCRSAPMPPAVPGSWRQQLRLRSAAAAAAFALRRRAPTDPGIDNSRTGRHYLGFCLVIKVNLSA